MKHTYDYIKQYISDEGYTLLSDTYKNNFTKLSIMCDKDHEYKVIFGNFRKGSRCPVCSGKLKHSYDYIKQFIEDEGYTLLSDTYKNNNSKLSIRCDKGHEYNTTFSNFRNGSRCPICYGKTVYTFEYVKSYIGDEGYTLLSDTYINAHSNISIRCSEGHEYSTIFNTFQQGHRCPICFGNLKHTYDYIKQYINDEGYTLLSDTYKNNKSMLLVKCPMGHEYKVTFGNFRHGYRCPICATINTSDKLKHTYDHVKQFINDEGYTLLSDTYENNKQKLLIRCSEGHEYSVKFNGFQMGCRCPICDYNKSSSKGEIEVQEYVRSLGISIISNDRTQIINPLTGKNLELDIWIPSMNKAIEYNGLYWHSFIDKKVKDEIKQDQCKQLGIDLLIINEHNWINNNVFEKELVRRFINGK